MKRRGATLAWTACLSLLTALAASTSTGTISGVIVDDTGGPIAGASVVYRSVPPLVPSAGGRLAPSSPTFGSVATSAADGTFSLSNLPAGSYNLCAYGTNTADLGSCEWVQGTTHVSLAAGQTVQLTFHVSQGALVTFVVQDPMQQIVSLEDLPTVDGRVPLTGANFAIGIWAGSRYVRAALVSKTATTRQYQVAIPKTATVRLYLDTSLSVLDASAVSIPTRQQSNAITAAGSAQLTVNLTVP